MKSKAFGRRKQKEPLIGFEPSTDLIFIYIIYMNCRCEINYFCETTSKCSMVCNISCDDKGKGGYLSHLMTSLVDVVDDDDDE